MKEHSDYFRSVDSGTYRAIAGFLQSNKLMKKAVERKEEEGENQKLFSLIQKKLAKGLSINRIAQEVEESVETVERLMKMHSI